MYCVCVCVCTAWSIEEGEKALLLLYEREAKS